MQHRDGYGNENDRNENRGNEVSQEERDWVYREYDQYYEKLRGNATTMRLSRRRREARRGRGDGSPGGLRCR